MIDNLVRSNRRSVSLEIGRKGELIVRAPLNLAHSSILDIVRKKSKWIKEKQQQIKERKFHAEDEKYFLGQKLRVITIHGEKTSVSFEKNNLFITIPQYRTVQVLLSIWYRKKALEIIVPRTLYLAKKFGFVVTKISISNARHRWGSCSKKGHISFSLRLIMLPSEIIDYIIIHELSHLLELNHSKRFWAVVQKTMPEYEEHEKWLKHNGYKYCL